MEKPFQIVDPTRDPIVTVPKLAFELDVNPRSIKNWAKAGALPAITKFNSRVSGWRLIEIGYLFEADNQSAS